MRYFPIFVDLRNRPVTVVGGTEEALRKVRLLLKTEAVINVVAPALHDELAAEPRVNWIARQYHAGLLEGAALVYSAEASLNARVAADARALGIPVNAVDEAEISSFIVPSIVDRDPIVVAIGTEGTAPVLGQGLRARIDALLPHGLGALARAAAELRERVASLIPPGNRRRAFWQRFFFGDVREAFLAGESCGYLAGVERLFESEASPQAGRVSFVSLGSADPELLTLKAQRKLHEADVIVHDRTVPAAILEMARRDALRLAVRGELYDGTADILIAEARAGKLVTRLSGSEPPLEETVAVAAEGIAFETVPAVAPAKPAEVIPFPVREDLRDAILRAAS
ncbi:NAD(P)-dependent oxidoreductase [Aestuariivirga sp.]|uniref:NAD(P)-dependent oxidoreductase n=1 Tax=Aestuariivirga sp. TaxID=2650926 RepID=UPI00391C3930